MNRWIAWWLVALLLGSCQRQAKPTPVEDEPSVDPAPAVAPAEPETLTGRARPANAAERDVVAELVRAAESVRQLRLQRAVTIEIEDGEAISASLRDQIDEEEIERAKVLYGALGLLDTEEDLRSTFAAVLSEQVIGYYDPETGRLVIREDVMKSLTGNPSSEETQEARLVLVHEIVHALQDQRLELGKSYKEERTADADNAFRAVVEGDATLAMLAHALRQQGIPLSAATEGIQQMGSLLDLSALVRGEKLDDAPAILRVTLVAPYLRGLQFVSAVQGRGGWPAVNNAHRRAPVSTEQVLHPNKYFAREPAEAISVKDSAALLKAGFERIADDTLGELEIGVYLDQGDPSARAEAAAAGWAGDQVVVYERDAETAVVWWTTWDTEDEAIEAFQAARAVSPEAPTARVERKGRAMLIVRDLPQKLHRAVRGDFSSFARRVNGRPAPPELPPNLVY